MDRSIEHDLPFGEAVRQITEIALRATASWESVTEFNEFRDPVYLKNRERVLVFANTSYNDFFTPKKSPIGRSGDKFLKKTIVNVSRSTDDFLLDGTNTVELDHVGRGADGVLYRLRTHKRSLAATGNPGVAILGVTRPEAILESAPTEAELGLAERYRIFNGLSESDRHIARLIGLGVTGREIAEEMDMNGRTVELRKKKLLELLGLELTVDLVKLLVRFEERGYVDLGL